MDEVQPFIENYWHQPQKPENFPNLSDEICNGPISFFLQTTFIQLMYIAVITSHHIITNVIHY